MEHKPFYLYNVYVKLLSLEHLQHQYITPGSDGLRIRVFFGSSQMETGKIKYFFKQDEIIMNFEVKLQSISAKKIEFWLKSYKTNKFLGSGEIQIKEDTSPQEDLYTNLTINNELMAVLRFQLDFLKEDISKEIFIEDDAVILKKDDTELRRKQEEEREREIQLKREQEEQEALKRAQAKKPIITVTTKNKQNETYL